jgi:DNA polymerase-4
MATIDPAQKVSWLYLDMNSFFASVEQELNPALRGKPVAVVPVKTDSTCCIAVSYEGKAFGVKTGTLVRDAKRMCPGMKFIEGDHANYVRYHNKILEAVDTCLPVEAVCSIDEIACRLTGRHQDVALAATLAGQVKAAIKALAGSSLRCSIGLGPNRFLSKMAADMQKPDGLTVIRPCDLPDKLYPLQPRDIPGVGARMEERLRDKGINTMRELLALSAEELRAAWGSICGAEMWHLLRGTDVPEKIAKSKTIGHSHVLPPELRNKAGAIRILKKLTDKAAGRLRAEGYYASSVYIYAKFIGREGWDAHCRVEETQDTVLFITALRKLWAEVPAGNLLAVGVVLGHLVPEAQHAPYLFEDGRRGKLMKTLDALNAKYGKPALYYGATHESAGLVPLRIAFTHVPDDSEL